MKKKILWLLSNLLLLLISFSLITSEVVFADGETPQEPAEEEPAEEEPAEEEPAEEDPAEEDPAEEDPAEEEEPEPQSAFRLQILHSSDNESAFQNPNPNSLEEKILNYGALIEGLNSLASSESISSIYVTSGDHTLPGPLYQASSEIERFGSPGLADIAFYNAMGLNANGLGNHEFDGGIDDFANMLATANYPMISANLDFSSVQLSEETSPIEIGVDGASVTENAGKVCKSAYIEINGEKIGLIGRSPAEFFNVVAEPSVTLPGLDFFGGRDPETNQPLQSALPMVLEQVQVLQAQGVNKIILLDHEQDFTGDPLFASEMSGIDIIVVAGGTGFISGQEANGPFNLIREGDTPDADYPTRLTDADGNPVLAVNTEQLYRYVGNLIVGFDENGIIDNVDSRSGPIATTAEAVAAMASEIGVETLEASEEVQTIWSLIQETESYTNNIAVYATTESTLNGERNQIRFRETNLGRVVADSTIWGAQQYLNSIDAPWQVDIALKNGGGIRATVNSPNINKLSSDSALAFNNRLSILQINAAELLATMENAVSRFPLFDGRFPQVAGMTLEFSRDRSPIENQISMTSPQRVGNLTVHRADGTDVPIVQDFQFVADPTETFVLATNNFLLGGGDGYRSLRNIRDDEARSVYETTIGEQQILVDYITGPLGGNVNVEDPPANPRVSVYRYSTLVTTTAAGGFDESAAEIVEYDHFTKRIFVVNAENGQVDVFDATVRPEMPLLYSIELEQTYGGFPNSLAIGNGVLAVALENADNKQANGTVAFFDTLFGRLLAQVEVGALPDSIAFTPDGTKVVIANEGEPSDGYDVDPYGSISVIDLNSGYVSDVDDITNDDVITLDFRALDAFPFFMQGALERSGIRIFGQIHDADGNYVRDSTIAEDLEPEFVTVTSDGTQAVVVLQENNAMAIVDLTGEVPVISDLFPLGFKDHSLEGNGFDASNRDGILGDIRPHPEVLGMYMPDGITTYTVHGQTYIVSANEGDSRDYDGWSEEVRVRDFDGTDGNPDLDPIAYPNADEIRSSSNLGRLKTTTTMGDYDGDGDIDQIYSYGGRSFSIWDMQGNLVWDSGDQLERITLERFPEFFNSTNDENEGDGRSDDKGPEPEAVVIAEINESFWAFVALERMGGVMIYDVTFPWEPVFIDYINNRNYNVNAEDDFPAARDLGPEGLKFVPAEESPTGAPTLIVANEISGTTTLYEIKVPAKPNDFQLQLIHSSDNESYFQDPNTGEERVLGYGAVIEGLKLLGARERMNTIYLTAGDHTLPNSFYQASAEVEEFGQPGLADIALYNAMGLNANGIGNHEFDGGINEFAHMLSTANYPMLAVNLDFSNVELEEGTPAIEMGVDGASVEENAGKIARSSYIEVGGEKIGLIGRAPAEFFNVISDPATTMPGLDFVGGRDPESNQPLESALPMVLEQVDLLESQGINKIILLDHEQDFTNDPLFASEMRGIDIIVVAGGTGFISGNSNGPFNFLREGDEPDGEYPARLADVDGNTVLAVNTQQLYGYVGNLMVSFDYRGIITSVDDRSGQIAATDEALELLANVVGSDSEGNPVNQLYNRPISPNERTIEIWESIQSTPLISSLFEFSGTTVSPLNGTRENVRTRETNLGRLAADSTLWYANEFAANNEIGFSVDMALKNGGGIRSDILGPSISRLAINAALAFDNTLALVELSAQELLATMENGVSRYPAFDGRFPQVAGMTVEFDPEQPGVENQKVMTRPSRIRNLVVGDDQIVLDFEFVGDPLRTFGLATNNFLLTGGDGYAALGAISTDPERPSFITEIGEQQILADFISVQLEGEVDIADPTESPRVSVYSQPEEEVEDNIERRFAAWSLKFLDKNQNQAAIDSDTNGDGYADIFSYAFNIDVNAPAISPNLPKQAVDGDDMLIQMTLTNDPDLVVDHQSSANVRDWRSLIKGTDYTVDSNTDNGDGTSTLILRINSVASDDSFFYRTAISARY